MNIPEQALPGRVAGYNKDQRTILNRLARCWASGNFTTIPDLLIRFDMTPPTFSWNPSMDSLPDARLKEMSRIWRKQSGTSSLPRLENCSLEVFREVPGLEGCLMILDFMRGKEVLSYRYYGNELASHSGTNWQGKTTADMARFSTHSLIFASSYLAVAARGEPLYSQTVTSPKMVTTTWCRYLLPYVNAQGRIIAFTCANIPVPGVPTWDFSGLGSSNPSGLGVPPGLSVSSESVDQPGNTGTGAKGQGTNELTLPCMPETAKHDQAEVNADSTSLEALLGMERNIRALLAHSPSALLILASGSNQIYFLNKALADMLGHEEPELVGKDPRQLFTDTQDYRQARLGAASGRSIRNREVLLRRKDGVGIWTLMSTHYIIFDHNRTTAFWFWDNSRRKAEEEALREAERHQLETIEHLEAVQKQLWSLANTDTLTGIPNRRNLDNLLEYEIRRMHRSGTKLALLMIDIDWFKQVNDRYGHTIGDEVLRHVARLMEARKRDTDTLARFGGEEFVLLLADTGSDGALALAEALRQAVADGPAQIGGLSISVTISIGIACTGANLKTKADILATADKALYKAKARGRNRVELVFQSRGFSGDDPAGPGQLDGSGKGRTL